VESDPLRIFIGSDESQSVAQEVLAYSIRKSATVPVEVVAMRDLAVPTPRDFANQPRTGFSFYRFLIPQLCGYQGRAVYLDADMLVLADVAALAAIPFDGHSVLCTFQDEPPAAWRHHPDFRPGRHAAVMVLDCSGLTWDIDEIVAGLDDGSYTYGQLVHDLCIVDPDDIADTVPPEWNHLERYEPGTTKLVHFTVAPTQPWKNDDNPLAELWMSWYREAVEAGAVSADKVRSMVAVGLAKPSLRAALRHAPNGVPASPRHVLASGYRHLRSVAARPLRAARR